MISSRCSRERQRLGLVSFAPPPVPRVSFLAIGFAPTLRDSTSSATGCVRLARSRGKATSRLSHVGDAAQFSTIAADVVLSKPIITSHHGASARVAFSLTQNIPIVVAFLRSHRPGFTDSSRDRAPTSPRSRTSWSASASDLLTSAAAIGDSHQAAWCGGTRAEADRATASRFRWVRGQRRIARAATATPASGVIDRQLGVDAPAASRSTTTRRS